MASRSISGSRAKIFADETEIGYGTGVSGSEIQQLIRNDVLGKAYSDEIIVIRRTISVQLQMTRIYKGSAKALGLMARGDTAALLNFPDLTLVIYDSVEDDAIETITGAKCESRSWSIDANGLLSSNVSFQAIRMKDEDEE